MEYRSIPGHSDRYVAGSTPERLAEVRKLLAEGRTHQFIADKFGVSRPVITRINTGERYQS